MYNEPYPLPLRLLVGGAIRTVFAASQQQLKHIRASQLAWNGDRELEIRAMPTKIVLRGGIDFSA